MSALSQPFDIRGIRSGRRIIVSPMCTYSCSENGMATDWRFATYARRAMGGAGLVMVEATSVDLIGRHSYADLGIWSDDHIPLAPHRRIHPGTRCGARDPVAACRP